MNCTVLNEILMAGNFDLWSMEWWVDMLTQSHFFPTNISSCIYMRLYWCLVEMIFFFYVIEPCKQT